MFPVFNKNNQKFLYLSLSSFLMMGALWPIKNLKDSLLITELGANQQPLARSISVIICLLCTLLYSQLVTKLKRETIIYVVTTALVVFGATFICFLGIYKSGHLPFDPKFIIYGFYSYSDVLNVMTIPVFWAFVNDVVTPEEAKAGYSSIVFAAQLGAAITVLLGAKMIDLGLNHMYISTLSIVFLILFGLSIYLFMKKVDKSKLQSYSDSHKKVEEKHSVPFLKGFFLIMASPYVFGILFLTFSQEIMTSIMQLKFFKIMEVAFIGDSAGLTAFMFKYSLLMQIISCTVSLTGSLFHERLGIKNCVILYPVLVLASFLSTIFLPTLIVAAGAQALIKGMHYALNKPSREMLYIPTTKDVKYTSKAWIESFGSRFFKLSGSYIAGTMFNQIAFVGSGILAVWIFVANFVGNKFQKSVEKKEIIV